MEGYFFIFAASLLDPINVVVCFVAGWFIRNRLLALTLAVVIMVLLTTALIHRSQASILIAHAIAAAGLTWGFYEWRSARRRKAATQNGEPPEESPTGKFSSIKYAVKMAPANGVVQQLLERITRTGHFSFDTPAISSKLVAQTWISYREVFDSQPPHKLAVAALALTAGLDLYPEHRNAFVLALGEILKETSLNQGKHVFSLADQKLLESAQKAFEAEARRLEDSPLLKGF